MSTYKLALNRSYTKQRNATHIATSAILPLPRPRPKRYVRNTRGPLRVARFRKSVTFQDGIRFQNLLFDPRVLAADRCQILQN